MSYVSDGFKKAKKLGINDAKKNAGAILGYGAGGIPGAIIGKYGQDTHNAANEKAPDMSGYEQAAQDILDKLEAGMPVSFEEQKWLEDYTPMLLGAQQEIGASALGGIKEDPALRKYQMDALAALADQANTGFSPADLAQQKMEEKALRRNTAGQLGAIRQNMASRGVGGSGLELQAQLMASQAADEQAANLALQREGAGYKNRMDAQGRAGDMARGMSGDQYQREADAARAADQIAVFNAQLRNQTSRYNNDLQNQAAQYNNQGRQGTANANVQGKNNFNQQGFENRARTAEIRYNDNSARGNRRTDEWVSRRNAATKRESDLINAGVGVGAAAATVSDKRAKNNIQALSDDEIDSFLTSLVPSSFNYKGDNKSRIGVMAQDVEKTPLGQVIVGHDENGVKNLDNQDLIGALLSSVALLHKRQKEREPYGS